MIDSGERYALIEHGVAIREVYTTTLLSAEEAIRLAKWLLWYYPDLDRMYRKYLDEQKKESNE